MPIWQSCFTFWNGPCYCLCQDANFNIHHTVTKFFLCRIFHKKIVHLINNEEIFGVWVLNNEFKVYIRNLQSFSLILSCKTLS